IRIGWTLIEFNSPVNNRAPAQVKAGQSAHATRVGNVRNRSHSRIRFRVRYLVQTILFNVRQNINCPIGTERHGGSEIGVFVDHLRIGHVAAIGQPAVVVVVVVEGNTDLVQVVGASHFVRGGANFLNGGQEQGHQENDDCDHH